MLWSLVYEFYIKHIFGGYLGPSAIYQGLLGYVIRNGQWTSINTATTPYIDLFSSGDLISIGNYLSLIATIITMIVILVLCAQLIKKIYNMCAHVIG